MKIAICDDQETQIKEIMRLIDDYPFGQPRVRVATFLAGETLLEAYRQGERFDLIFLDIEMGEVSGIAVAERIRVEDQEAMIFFITSHHQFVRRAYRVDAVQYLEKPLTPAIFWEEFQRCLEKYHQKNCWITLKTTSGVVNLNQMRIVYLHSDNKYTNIHCSNGQVYRVRQSTAKLIRELDQTLFTNCHRSYYINLSLIELVGQEDIITTVFYAQSKQPMSVPVSRERYQAVLDALLAYRVRCLG